MPRSPDATLDCGRGWCGGVQQVLFVARWSVCPLLSSCSVNPGGHLQAHPAGCARPGQETRVTRILSKSSRLVLRRRKEEEKKRSEEDDDDVLPLAPEFWNRVPIPIQRVRLNSAMVMKHSGIIHA